MIGSLGWQELLIILVILALLFGASRVASLGGALGRGIREFRTEARGADDDGDDKDEKTDGDATASSSATQTSAASDQEKPPSGS